MDLQDMIDGAPAHEPPQGDPTPIASRVLMKVLYAASMARSDC